MRSADVKLVSIEQERVAKLEAARQREAVSIEAIRLEAIRLEAIRLETARQETARQETANKQEEAKQDTKILVRSVKMVPQIVEEVEEVSTPIQKTGESPQNLVDLKAIETFREAMSSAINAKTDEIKAHAFRSGYDFKAKLKATMDANAKLGSANKLAEQLKGCEVPLKELLNDCITQYTDDKCSDEAFDVVVGKCTLDPTAAL